MRRNAKTNGAPTSFIYEEVVSLMPRTLESTQPGREAFLARFAGDPVALSNHMRELARERARYTRLGKLFMEALTVIGYAPKERVDRTDD